MRCVIKINRYEKVKLLWLFKLKGFKYLNSMI